MTNQEICDLINTLNSKVIDWDADGECCYYILVPDEPEVRDVLYKLGYNDEEIESFIENEGEIDIAPIGFEYAEWWQSTKGFSIKKPVEA